MVSLIIYSIKSALCLTVLYLPFSLFLRNEKRHRLNRIVLLSILAVSFIILILIMMFKPGGLFDAGPGRKA